MSETDIIYHKLVNEIITLGDVHENRTGTPTRRIWGHMAKFDLANDGFPLLTQKKMAVKTAFVEMLGFCRGETSVKWYEDHGCKIWSADHARWHSKDLEKDRARSDELAKVIEHGPFTEKVAAEYGKLADSINHRTRNPTSLGRIYGAQWRNFGGFDQLGEIITALQGGSNSRRLIMSAWAPNELHMMALPPCHIAYHFVKRGLFVDVAMWQRSCDTALGVPFNWATTALLCHLVGHACGLKPGRMAWFGDDVHIYEPHVETFKQQFKQLTFPAPTLEIKAAPGAMPWEVNYEDIELKNYQCSEKVPFELFVG
ncbi:MAG: thymidylate synthase [Phycisphaerae bacterium]|jgi:thymidylate synthase